MKTTRLLAWFPIASLLAGCGSAPHDDAAQSADDALTVYKSGTMDATGLALLESLVGVGGASVTATDGVIHFVPSPQMAALGTPQVDATADDLLVNLIGAADHVRIQGFYQDGAPTFAFEASGPGSIDMHLPAYGTVYILPAFCFSSVGAYPCLTGDGDKLYPIYATMTGPATIDARFLVDGNGVLGVDDVKVSYAYGAASSAHPQPLYDLIHDNDRDKIEKWFGGEIKKALAAGLAAYQSTWIGGLNKYVNYTRVVQKGLVQPPPWQIIPPSLAVAGAGMAWTAKREHATTAPTGCKASTACESYVSVACTPSTDRLELELYSGGQWTEDFQAPVSATTTNAFSFTAKGAAWMQLRVCAVNGTGKSCGAPMTVYPNHAHCPPLCTRDAAGVLHCVTGGTTPSGGAQQ